MSPTSQRVAKDLGYTNAKVYHAGMPDWKKNAGMILADATSIQEMVETEASFVLIDLRSKRAAKKGHIPGAINIPAKKLADAKDIFPKNKKAPIYLYDKGVNVKAFKMVSGWKYKKVSVINGGFGAWKGKVAKGKIPAPDKIVYTKKLPKNQISIKEFKSIVEQQPADKFILDVRDMTGGMLKGAVNISLDSISGSLKDIPKDKEILVYCNTGVLAKSAAKKLKEKGYNVRFLNAVVQVADDGKYEINEKL